MPSRPAPTAKSSSRSSKSADVPPVAGLVRVAPDPTAVAVAEIGAAHGLRGQLHLWPYQGDAPSLEAGRRVFLERDDAWLEVTIVAIAPHGRGMLLTLD